MPITYTPLRYPGGKSKCYNFMREILRENQLIGGTYMEPFAGGAGLAIKLLLKNEVGRIILNDIDPAIYAFWFAVINSTETLCRKIIDTPITYEQWCKEKRIYETDGCKSQLDLAFATLFLNRTNRSGIIKGGVIGGKHQDGDYKLDARFNKKELVRKIYTIAQQRKNIDLYNLNAKQLISSEIVSHDPNIFLYIDPPYVKKGGQLYQNAFSSKDHAEFASQVLSCQNKWVVTYDICDFISNLYRSQRYAIIKLGYSVNQKKVAKEFAYFSSNLIVPKNHSSYPQAFEG